MFVEGLPHNGKEVFHAKHRLIGCSWILLGIALGTPCYWAFLELNDGEVGLVGVLVGILLVVYGLKTVLTVDSLVVDRSQRLLVWSRKTPISRRQRTLSFDELRHIRVNESFYADPNYRRIARVYLVPESGKPIKLGEWLDGGVRSLIKRIEELTGVGVHVE